MTRYYETTHANVHRGVYATAEEATAPLRARPGGGRARFIGAPDPAHEIVFTKNTTESINLVAHPGAGPTCRRATRVLLTEMEHHANIVPWLILAEERRPRAALHPARRRGPPRPRPTSTTCSTG